MIRISVCLLLSMLVMLVCAFPVYSETVVEGVASGVWEPSGNPYILSSYTVVVPLDSTLDIMPGTEIQFGDCEYFRVLGVISATGSEEFPVQWETGTGYNCSIGLASEPEDTNRFARVHFSGDRDYLRISSTDGCTIWDSCQFNLNHKNLILNVQSDWIMDNNLWFNTAITLEMSSGILRFTNDRMEGEGSVVAYVSADNILIQNSSFMNSELYLDATYLELDNNELGVCLVEGGAYVTVNDNDLEMLQIESSNHVTVSENHFRKNMNYGYNGYQFLCEAGQASISGNRNINDACFIEMFVDSEIEYNEFTANVTLSDCQANFHNNTLVLLHENYTQQDRAILTCRDGSRATIDNNIFVGVSELLTPCAIEVMEQSDVNIRNNCFHRVGEPVTGDQAHDTILADPCFVNEEAGDYHLQAHSPCIDAGAAGYWDEDASVADVGAFPFDNREAHPPTLATARQVQAVKGEMVRFTVCASDDGETLDISFSGLPCWLSPGFARSELDAVLDSVMLEGVVPTNATDSWVVVTMLSGNNETSVDSLLVHVYEQRLSGELSGTISASEAPYLMDGDTWIAENGNALFEPGVVVEVLEDLNDPLGIDIYGDVELQGIEADSIVFRSAALFPGRHAWRGITLREDPAEIAFRYVVIEDADTALSVITSQRISLHDSRFSHCRQAVTICSSDTSYISRSEFFDNKNGVIFTEDNYHRTALGYLDSLLFRDTRRIAVDMPPGRLSDSRIEGGYGGICRFRSTSGGGEYQILNNYISDCYYGFQDWYSSTSMFMFKNNIFVNCCYIDLNGSSVTYYYLYNNTFYAPEVPRYSYISGSFTNSYLVNNILYCTYPADHEGNHTEYSRDYNLINMDNYAMYGVGNIHADPLFHNAAEGDFHLMEGSPCIDAGDPTFPYDPDGTRADIGAIPYDPDWVQVEDLRPLPTEDDVCPLYPNPFNGTTTLKINLSDMADVQVHVFNILGQRVGRYQWESLCGGEHRLHLDRQGLDFTTLASGVYFFRVELMRAKGNELYMLKAVHIK